jgi:hypothetical protein
MLKYEGKKQIGSMSNMAFDSESLKTFERLYDYYDLSLNI